MRLRTASMLAGLALTALVAPAARAQSGAWIVMLGNDTTAVEQYSRSGNTLTGDLVTRQGGTQIAHYVLTLNANASPNKIDVTYSRPDGSALPANAIKSVSAQYTLDSVFVTVMRDTAIKRRFAAAGAYPVLGAGSLAASMGLYEAALAHMRKNTTTDSIAAFLVAPTALATPQQGSWIKFYGADSARVWVFGFPWYARVDRAGHLFGLSGRATTQKIEPRRLTTLDVMALAKQFAAADASTRTVASSAKDSVRTTINGATIAVDYFRPTARGRNVFSNGVLGDTIWRTGANNATEFKTDKDLVISGQTVPAGTYTLWTHVTPNNSRYELIFNKQTKIWGTAYNPANDLIRVPLTVSRRASPMEAFQIGVDAPGVIRLSWVNTDLTVPFTVK